MIILARTVVQLLAAAVCWGAARAFPTTFRLAPPARSWSLTGTSSNLQRHASATDNQQASNSNSLYADFYTASGEALDPYRILKVERDANLADVKEAYRQLSRRYHPDGVRHRDILPGKCNNLDDVRDEWERIRLSYYILKDKKLRARFDRHDVLSDPGRAFSRAASQAAWNGLVGMGRGIFGMGASVAVGVVSTLTDPGKAGAPAASATSSAPGKAKSVGQAPAP